MALCLVLARTEDTIRYTTGYATFLASAIYYVQLDEQRPTREEKRDFRTGRTSSTLAERSHGQGVSMVSLCSDGQEMWLGAQEKYPMRVTRFGKGWRSSGQSTIQGPMRTGEKRSESRRHAKRRMSRAGNREVVGLRRRSVEQAKEA